MVSPSRIASSLHLGALSLLSAFLLFQVQPVISKFILPWFGGSPGVWTTAMLFFQVLLFAGYAYAHGLTRLPMRWQWIIHSALVLAAVCALPIEPDAKWKPTGTDDPVGRILIVLLANVALPYFVLSSTSPLVQVWFSRAGKDRSPWRLYSLSNIGSLAALLSYPFFFEPRWDVTQQTRMWSYAFVAFAVLSWWGALRDRKTRSLADGEAAPASSTVTELGAAPSWSRRLVWLLLPAVASVLLLATTNHLCQDVAVIPFLWVLPLSLYLLTFIICFEHERWYVRPLWALPALLLLFAAGTHEALKEAPWLLLNLTPNFQSEIALICSAMFLGCMVCHGELARRKPDPRHLTEFYLLMSAGGALGGLFVSLAAPRLFKTYAEWPLALMLAFAIASVVLLRIAWSLRGNLRRLALLCATSVATALGLWFASSAGSKADSSLETVRNFYGVVTVQEDADEAGGAWRTLYHGSIIHGYQYMAPEWRNEPLSYYGNETGIGRALLSLKDRPDARVGVVGMGTGTVAAYGRKGHTFRFYDINPEIVRIARQHFYFLEEMEKRGGTVEIALGDARLTLEREEPQRFDLMLLDAFSGDAVPVHLLTREAFEIYLRHLKPDGIIAVHVSNRYLILAPVIERLAASLNLKTTRITTELDGFYEHSSYVLMTNNEGFLKANPSDSPEAGEPEAPTLWTDRRHNLFEIFVKD